AVEVREPGTISEIRRCNGLALRRHFMDGPISEIDELLWILHPGAAAALMAAVGRARRIPSLQRLRHRGVIDRSRPAAVAHGLEFAVPVRRRQPELDLDVRIARWLQRGRDAAK